MRFRRVSSPPKSGMAKRLKAANKRLAKMSGVPVQKKVNKGRVYKVKPKISKF